MTRIVTRGGSERPSSRQAAMRSAVALASIVTLGAITFAWIERPAMTGQFPFGLRRVSS